MYILSLLACLVVLLVPGTYAAPASICVLSIVGEENTGDIKDAFMICKGPAPAVALDSHLQMFADNFLGVDTTDEDCQSSDNDCLLRICGDATVNLTDITNIQLGHVVAGVLCIASDTEVTIKNSIFQNNTATASLITVDARATLNTDNVYFEKNAAIIAETSSSSEDSESVAWGGAILGLSNATLNIHDTFFVENSAATSGGAVGAYKSVVNVTDSYFSLNTAPTGGAIWVSKSMLSLDNTTFEANEAEASGGALAVFDASAVGSMSKASSSIGSGSDPGASSRFGPSSILSESEPVPMVGLSIVKCNFSHNNVQTQHGGGLAIDTVEPECIVSSDGGAGAAVVFFIQGTTFVYNMGDHGSAISARLHSNEKLIIANSTLLHNAGSNGSPIFAFPINETCSGGSVEVREVSFTSNAGEGLLAARNTPLKFVGESHFYDNVGACDLVTYQLAYFPEYSCAEASFQGMVCLDVSGTVLSMNGDVTGAPRVEELCKSEETLKHIAIVYSIFAALLVGISICGVIIGCRQRNIRRRSFGMIAESPVPLRSSRAPAALPVTHNAAGVTSYYGGGSSAGGLPRDRFTPPQESRHPGWTPATRTSNPTSSSSGRSSGLFGRIGGWMHGPGGYQLLGLFRCGLMFWDILSDVIVLVKLYQVRYSSSLWVAYLVLLPAANMIATLVLHFRLVALAHSTGSSSSGGSGVGGGIAYAASSSSLRPYVWMAAWVGCGVCGQLVQLLFPWFCCLLIIDHPMMWAHAATSRRLKRGSAPGVDLTSDTPPPEQQQQQRGAKDHHHQQQHVQQQQQQQHWQQQQHVNLHQPPQQQRCCTCCCCCRKTPPPTPKSAAFPWLHLEHYASLHSFWLTLVESIPTTAITTWAYHAGAAPGRPLVINTWLFYFSSLPALLGVAYWYGLLLIKGVQGELKEEFREMFWGIVRVSPGGSPGDIAGTTGVTSGKNVVNAGRGDIELATAAAGGRTVLPPAAAVQ